MKRVTGGEVLVYAAIYLPFFFFTPLPYWGEVTDILVDDKNFPRLSYTGPKLFSNLLPSTWLLVNTYG